MYTAQKEATKLLRLLRAARTSAHSEPVEIEIGGTINEEVLTELVEAALDLSKPL